jgi:MFS family permease
MIAHDAYAALRLRPYRHFLAGRAVFMVGSQMQTAAVGWQLYERLHSKMALAYVGLVQIIPILLLAIPSGHLADHFSRKRIILTSQTLFLSCSLGLGALSWSRGPVGWTYLLLGLLGVARSFSMPSMAALLPAVIPREAWGNAATWNSSVFELMQIAGPASAGAVIAASGGATAVYFTAAACALASIACFSLLRPVQVAAPRKAVTLADFATGLRFMFRTKLLLAAASLDLFAVLLGGATALLPVVAKDILHVGPVGFGWLRAAPSLGAVTMAVFTAHIAPWQHAGRVLFLALTGFGAATIVFGLSRNFWLSMAMLMLTGVFDNLNVVIRQTLVQFVTPDAMRGRVSSINFLFIGCSNELGAFESGLTAQLLGTVPAIVAGGIGTIAVVLIVRALSPQLRSLGAMHKLTPAPVN